MTDALAVAGPSHYVGEELSDEQMQAMLVRAAERRRTNASLKLSGDAADDSNNNKKYSFPKLNTGEIAKPYVSTTGEVAQVDASRLLQEKDRLLANKVRKVEDPVVVKKKAAEVCPHSPTQPQLALSFAYEENIPNFFT